MGVITYYMCVGELPFKDVNIQKTMNKILFSKPVYPENLSTQLRDIIERMLTKPQDQRITLDDIKKHAWFSPREFSYINSFTDKTTTSFSFNTQTLLKYEQYGLSTQSLRQSLLAKEYNEETAIWRLIKRHDLIIDMKYSTYIMRTRRDSSSKIACNPPPPKSPRSAERQEEVKDEENEDEKEMIAPRVYHRAQRQRKRAFSSNRPPPNPSLWY